MKFSNVSRSIFLKSCYFLSILLVCSCKSDATTKTDSSIIKNEENIKKKSEKNASRKIVFFGDSLTAGYGLEDVNNAFPGLIQKKIDSLGLNYTIINSGVSGETSAGGKNRINWVLNKKPDIFVLELGANDGLRGVNLKETRNNLQSIISTVKEKFPNTIIVLVGMQIPPNMGQEYTTEFKAIFPDLARKNNIEIVPFLLKNVGGIAALNQSDGIHPTKEGHKILAKNTWEILSKLIN